MDKEAIHEFHEIERTLGRVEERLHSLEKKIDQAIETDTARLNKHSEQIDTIQEQMNKMQGAIDGKSNLSNLMISIAVAIGPIVAIIISRYI